MSDLLPTVTIYSDGSCEPNPGPGGWAALLIFADREETLSGGEPATTNNRMELTAAVRALQSLKTAHRVTLYTDSQYLQRGITEWMPNWIKRGWRRSGGVLANQELWQALDAITRQHTIQWRWLRGHAGHPRNEQVDRLARAAMRAARK